MRIAHGAFSEKVAIMWVGAEQGIFSQDPGVHVEVINIRSGLPTNLMAALASGDIQSGLHDSRNRRQCRYRRFRPRRFLRPASSIKPTVDFIASTQIRAGGRLERQIASACKASAAASGRMAMLALEHLGLEPTRGQINGDEFIGDSPVLAQSLESGGIEATYLNYTHSRSLKDNKVFLSCSISARRPSAYQGLAAATRRTDAASTSADYRLAYARLRRNSHLHTQAVKQGGRDQNADERPAQRNDGNASDAENGQKALQTRISF